MKPSGIPNPILNRMNVFEIQPLTPGQARTIASRLHLALRSHHDWGSRFDERPADDLLDKLDKLARRGTLHMDDLPRAIASRGGIGFLQQAVA